MMWMEYIVELRITSFFCQIKSISLYLYVMKGKESERNIDNDKELSYALSTD